MAKKKKTRGTQEWQAEPNDAIRLAALRWFALDMERIAIQIYATDQSAYPAMEHVLRDMLKKLVRIHKSVNALSDDDCPDGYIRCKDNTCAPSCEGILGAASES